MIRRKQWLIAFSILLISFQWQNLNADLYKWIDDKGTVHYGDNPPEKARLKKISGAISSFTTVNVEKFRFDAKLVTSSDGGAPSVIIYSTSWCGYCKKAKKYFNKNNIKFTEYDIENNSRARKQYKKMNGRGVPLILVGKKRMNGFSESGFKRIYNKI